MELPPLVVIGASSGGVEALTRVCAGLPADFPGAVLLVLHVDAHPSLLPEVIARRAALPVAHAADGDILEPGRIYVAPPDVHMAIEGATISLDRGPKEHHTRPAIDPLFRSAAAAAAKGARVAAVVLTGDLNDGTRGVHYVKRAGGIAVVQDPDEAVAPSMPRSACSSNDIDFRAPLEAIPAYLTEWARRETGLSRVTSGVSHGMSVSHPLPGFPAVDGHENDRTLFVCPSCLGSLVRVGKSDEYACYVGHRFTLETLAHAQSEATDDTLWSAYRALCEKALLLQLLAEESRAARVDDRAADYERQRMQAVHAAQAIHDLTRHVPGSLVARDPVP